MTADDMKAAPGRGRVSGSMRVPRPMMDLFADATSDHQSIHGDPQRAQQTPFGTTVAHTPVPSRPGDTPMTLNCAGNSPRFVAPALPGTNACARSRLIAFEEQGAGRYRSTNTITIGIEGSAKPAPVAEWITPPHT